MSDQQSRMATETGHRFDYYYRPGMPLRPAPPRIQPSPDWRAARERLLTGWRDIEPTPRATSYTALLDDHYWQGDALMDPVVALSVRIGARAVRDMLDTALDEGIDALDDPPIELVELFAQLDHVPAWFDREVAERGRVVLGNATFYGKMCGLVVESLFTALGVPVSSAAGATGMFARNAARRLVESDHYFWNVSRPGVFDRYAEPFKINVRVRLMHSYARHGLHHRWGVEHFAHHGNPISNTNMASGVAGFGLLPLLYDIAKGASHPVADLDAALMYWGYIGYVFGVAEEIRPRNVSEAVELLDCSYSAEGSPTVFSDEMSAALVGLIQRTLAGAGTGPVSRVAQRGGTLAVGALAHHLVGDPLAARLLATPGRASKPTRILSGLIDLLAPPVIALSQALDRRPGRASRRRRRLADGDPFLAMRYRTAKAFAEQHGVHASTYDSHEGRTPDSYKAPVPDPRTSD